MKFSRFLLVLSILLSVWGFLYGQAGATGTVLGTMTDSSGGHHCQCEGHGH
jgi:hypothetical protein